MTGMQKSAVIVGATGGIGSALARRLSRQGWKLVLTGRDAGRLETLVQSLDGSAHFEVMDALDSGQVDAVMERTVQSWGNLPAVVHCAGSLLLKPIHLTTDADWNQTLSTHLTTAFLVTRAAVSRMMKLGGGSIVLVSSAVAQRGMINHEAVAAAKAGIVGLAQSAAATYARYQIRVNCVAPGLTRTPLTEQLIRNEASLKISSAMHPLGRIGEADEVASAMAWLIDPEQSWVTGQVVGVDGGLGCIQAR